MTASTSSDLTAPALGQRVYLSRQGWSWTVPLQSSLRGWFRWREGPGGWRCLGPASYAELSRLRPLKTVYKLKPNQGCFNPHLQHPTPLRLELDESFSEGDWLQCWMCLGVAWVVGPASAPPVRRRDRLRQVRSYDLAQAVARGGGQFLGATLQGELWQVRWRRGGADITSLVDQRLNVVQAGFCLSGQDRRQDLTTLVSLLEGEESRYAHSGGWDGYSGW